jgi:hypothetical protein
MLELFTLLKFTFAFLLGFVIPGFFVSLILECRRPWLSAFIISSVILFNIVFYAGVSGITINFSNIFSLLVLVSTVLGAWAGISGKLKNFRNMFKFGDIKIQLFFIIPAACLLLLLAARAFCQPLMSPDSVFRWNYLAVKIFETGSFAFYPPLSPEDFKSYFYVDGIPPLVQFSYYWLYASFGSISAIRLTAILVVFQYASIVLLCYYSASHIFQSSKAGTYSVLLLLSSAIFFFSLFLGQETGLTALSMAATIYFLSGADGKESISNSVLAGFSTALGALSREYGIAFIVIGMLICLWRKRTRSNILAYLLSASLLCVSWYAYLFLRTGNPFYSLSIGTLFPVNEVFDGIYKTYVIYFGLGSQTMAKIKFIINLLLTLSPLHFLLLPALFLLPFKKTGYLIAASLIVILIWLNSIGYTCGGYFYSSRTLSPLIVLISIAAGGIALRFSKGKTASMACGAVVSVFLIWGAYQDLCIPEKTSEVPFRFIYNSAFGRLPKPGIVDYASIMELPENAKVLSDSALHHGALMTNPEKNRKMIDFIPVWSPEVAFLFNPGNSYEKALAELRGSGIRYLLYSKNSYNNAYLEKYPFFREYSRYSKRLYEDANIVIYRLP